MISNEDLELVQKAQAIILKLDAGGSVAGGSQEHIDLSRAITKLSGLVLFQPMTNEDALKLREVVEILSVGNRDVL